MIGISGAPLVAFIVLYLRFTGSTLSMKPWALTLITAYNWTGNTIVLSTYASQNLVTLLLVAGIAPAVLADTIIHRSRLQDKRTGYAFAGLAWGIIFGSVFYPLTNGLLNAPFDLASLLLISLTSSVAGLASGVLAWSQWSPLSHTKIRAIVRIKQEIVTQQ